MLARVHAVISGEVQGVGYRYFVKRLAAELDINGWVKNNTDGTVELEAEGEKEKLSQYLQRLKTEHSYASIESVETKWLPFENKYSNFSIKLY